MKQLYLSIKFTNLWIPSTTTTTCSDVCIGIILQLFSRLFHYPFGVIERETYQKVSTCSCAWIILGLIMLRDIHSSSPPIKLEEADQDIYLHDLNSFQT
jgi:hypothetical protein